MSTIINTKINLPVTEYIIKNNRSILKKLTIIRIDHLLNDVLDSNELLIKQGCQLIYIAVPYGEKRINPRSNYPYIHFTRENSRLMAYLNGKPLLKGQEFLSIQDAIATVTKYVFKTLLPKLPENREILVIQDGGYLSFVNQKIIPHNFIGVTEQTQSGINAFERLNAKTPLTYPVITIARSKIKTQFEPEFIAQRVGEELNYMFYSIGEFLRYKTVVLAGYGIIGRQVAHFLRQLSIEVIIIDIHPQLRRLAEREGFRSLYPITPEIIDKSFCYLGCTGKDSFNIDSLYQFLKSTKNIYYVASGSSKQLEFESVIKFFNEYDHSLNKYRKSHPDLKKISFVATEQTDLGTQYTIKYEGEVKKLILLADGTPINFRKDSESVPDKAIDPVISELILGGISLKSKPYKPGIHYIGNPKTDKKLAISENFLINKWCELNNIDILSDDILSQFSYHPLRNLLSKGHK